ncbi:MAG: DUF1877 family protein [Thiotrichaceae bacterium]|nr:DUF1877 family protein [Thiotrichaceae bacterium]
MSFGADFIAISEQKLSELQDTPRELCDFLRKELDEQPSESLCIDDAWDILAQTLDKLGVAFSVELEQLEGLPCAEMAFYVPAERVVNLAKQLAAYSRTELSTTLESLDYEEIYHGEHWSEEQEEFLELFETVVAFFKNTADRNEAVAYLLT